MKTRVFSILLLFVMLATAACGSGGGNTPAADTTASAITTEADTEAAPAETEIISRALPEKNYNNYEFTFLTTNKTGAGYLCYELDAESMTGEIMNDSVYTRNTKVEEQFGIRIAKAISASPMDDFKKSVMARLDNWDVLVDTTMAVLQASATYGLSVDNLPYVDLSRDWWDRKTIEGTALGGVNYALSGDINLVDDDSLWVIYFNKRLAEEYQAGDLYQMVYDGKWTIDAMQTIAARGTRDLNGDTVQDHTDQWGFVASGNHALSMLWSGGGRLSTLNQDGTLTLTLDSARNLDVLSRVRDLFSATDTVMPIDNLPSKVNGISKWTYCYTMFSEGRSLFFGYCLYTLPNFRDMDDDFGYLPCPKYDEAQQDYISIMQPWIGTSLLVPNSASDPERTSIILEAMASAAQHYITPTYYDVVLTRKNSRDEESFKIVDLLRSNRTFDLAYAYDMGGVRNLNSRLVSDSNTIASTLAGLTKQAQAANEATLKSILDAQK